MKLGENAHIFFKSHVQQKNFLQKLTPKNFLKSVECILYFLNNEEFETRVYLHNYLPLLGDSPDVRAKWYLNIYSPEGKKVAQKEGIFVGPQGAVIEVAKLGNVGTHGVVSVRIQLEDDTHQIDKPLRSIFFVEFTEKGVEHPRKVISHSLNSPVAGIYGYNRSFTGLILRPDCKLYLLIANGSYLRVGGMSQAAGVISFTNADREVLEVPLPVITESMGCRKLDLLEMSPDLRRHVGGKPFNLKIKGKNILSKPFLIMRGEQVFQGDHL
jgi:hypothetical protein